MRHAAPRSVQLHRAALRSSALASALGCASPLVALDLSGNELGDEGAEALGAALGAASSLTSLDLHYNYIRPLGAHALAAALASPRCRLRQLNLQNNSIRGEGAAALAAALGPGSHLEHLCLRYNNIRDQVAAFGPLLAPGGASSLWLLDLSNNDVAAAEAEALVAQAAKNPAARLVLGP